MLYAEVAVEAGRALDRETYSYSVPAGLEVVPGHRVWVPFGRRGSYGYVVSVHADDPGIEVREVERADPQPLLLPHQVELARVVAERYWAPLLECLRAMVPPRVRGGRSSGAGPSARQTRHSQLLAFARPSAAPVPGPPLNGDQRLALEAMRLSGLRRSCATTPSTSARACASISALCLAARSAS